MSSTKEALRVLYFEKAEGNRRAAEICHRSGEFNSAASRYYYSLFICAKGILERDGFDYKGFLRGSAHLNEHVRSHKRYSHSTIHIALAVHKNFDVEPFKNMWNVVYKYRIWADYYDRQLTQGNIDECRENFYSIYRRIRNGR